MYFSQHPIYFQGTENIRGNANPRIVDTMWEKGLIKYDCLWRNFCLGCSVFPGPRVKLSQNWKTSYEKEREREDVWWFVSSPPGMSFSSVEQWYDFIAKISSIQLFSLSAAMNEKLVTDQLEVFTCFPHIFHDIQRHFQRDSQGTLD